MLRMNITPLGCLQSNEDIVNVLAVVEEFTISEIQTGNKSRVDMGRASLKDSLSKRAVSVPLTLWNASQAHASLCKKLRPGAILFGRNLRLRIYNRKMELVSTSGSKLQVFDPDRDHELVIPPPSTPLKHLPSVSEIDILVQQHPLLLQLSQQLARTGRSREWMFMDTRGLYAAAPRELARRNVMIHFRGVVVRQWRPDGRASLPTACTPKPYGGGESPLPCSGIGSVIDLVDASDHVVVSVLVKVGHLFRAKILEGQCVELSYVSVVEKSEPPLDRSRHDPENQYDLYAWPRVWLQTSAISKLEALDPCASPAKDLLDAVSARGRPTHLASVSDLRKVMISGMYVVRGTVVSVEAPACSHHAAAVLSVDSASGRARVVRVGPNDSSSMDADSSTSCGGETHDGDLDAAAEPLPLTYIGCSRCERSDLLCDENSLWKCPSCNPPRRGEQALASFYRPLRLCIQDPPSADHALDTESQGEPARLVARVPTQVHLRKLFLDTDPALLLVKENEFLRVAIASVLPSIFAEDVQVLLHAVVSTDSNGAASFRDFVLCGLAPVTF
eukprot:Rmarinus@m.754